MTDAPRPAEGNKKPRFPFPEFVPHAYSWGEPVVWDASTLPDCNAWATVFGELFPLRPSTHPERAARLAGYGWTPEELRVLCTQPVKVETIHRRFEEWGSEDANESLAAIMQEVSLFHEQAAPASRNRRDNAAAYLMRNCGWTPEQVGSLLGKHPEPVEGSPAVDWADVPEERNSDWWEQGMITGAVVEEDKRLRLRWWNRYMEGGQ